jgi:hypothetical protein
MAAQELTNPLTTEEAACNEAQLEHLLQRMNAAEESYVTPQASTHLLVSYSNSVGFYDGLVATDQSFRVGPGEIPPFPSYEHYLTFNINPGIRALLLNPARPMLAEVSLNREQSSSNLVTPEGHFGLTLTLEPTLGGGPPLTINNFEVPAEGEPYNGFLANSTKPGRGLIADGLLTSCHDKLTPFDRHIFSILQRMIRADPVDFFRADTKTSIFRGEDPHTYRINVYPIYEHFEPRGRMAVELKIAWTPQGRLTTGELIALPGCTVLRQAGCSALTWSSPWVRLIPPVFGGHENYSYGAVSDSVNFDWFAGVPSPPVTIDFQTLLAKTTWNEPVW